MKTEKEFAEFIGKCCKGNADAAAFLVTITEAAHFFDDLYDKDVTINRHDLYEALWKTMIVLPRNEFYRKFFWELQPLVTNAVVNWQVANAMEEFPVGEVDFRVAFVIRSSYADLIQQVALLCGGPEWAVQVGVEVRRECHSEPWQDYIKSVGESHGILQRAEATGPESGDDRSGAGQRTHRHGTDGPWPRAVRVGEAERGAGPPDADPDLPAAATDS
jgi:hypothetical protein